MKALISIVFFVFAIPTAARADGLNASFGFVYGTSVADASNTKPYWLTGIKGTAYAFPNISVGGYYYYSDSSADPSHTERFRYEIQGVEAAYHMPAGQGEVFFGLRGGFTKVDTESSGNKLTYSPYHLGVSTGYDYLVAPWCSLGFEGSLLHIKKGHTSMSGVDYHLDAFNTISFLGTIQFRM